MGAGPAQSGVVVEEVGDGRVGAGVYGLTGGPQLNERAAVVASSTGLKGRHTVLI